MPPGAKNRRAAKKKKGNRSNNHSNPSSSSAHSHGDEFVKHHDEKDPDVGEVSSPGSQDHHNHHNPSTEWEEEEIEKKNNNPNLGPTEGSKIDKGVVQVEREFKIEGKSDGNNGKVIERDEAIGKSYNGGSFSSSNSSSDDEVHGIKNDPATEDTSSVSHSGKVVDPLSGRSGEAIHSAPIEEVKQDKVESLLEGNEKKPSCVEDKFGTSLEKNDEAIVQSVEGTDINLDEEVSATEESNYRLTLPYNEPRGADDNRAGQEKECSVSEPLLVPSPYPEKKTSWKSCCGLFEIFSGSGR